MSWRPTPGPTLALLLLGALVVRVLYVLAQPATDPTFAAPILDGDYYMSWGASLAEGGAGPDAGQAYYLAPLYPFLLSAFFRIAGGQVGLLYILQHALIVAAAGLLFLAGSRLSGAWAGVAAAALLLAYQPVLFFASRPIGESVSLFFLALGLFLATRSTTAVWRGLSGLTLGVGSLARPNVLLVTAAWTAIEGLGRNWRGALLLAGGTLLAVAPVTVRNWRASGHPVLISSNGGLTLYHGNQPGVRGIGMIPLEFSGRLDQQRQEATRAASRRSGRQLDPVEADHFWGAQAVQARRLDPVGTLQLALRRVALTVSSVELSLDYAPSLDLDPWRRTAPAPFGAILGLALAALWLAGLRGSGGALVWSAVAATAVVPLAFYVSSRYRLPLAACLCVPAGIGLVALGDRRIRPRRRAVGLGIASLMLAVSLLVGGGDVRAMSEAVALANRADSWKRAGRPDRAEVDLKSAIEEDPTCVSALFGLGVLAESSGQVQQAEQYYRQAIDRSPAHAEAAGNLGRLLILQKRASEAVPVLQRALEFRSDNAACWTNLAMALFVSGREEEARRTAHDAARFGVVFSPEIQAILGDGASKEQRIP